MAGLTRLAPHPPQLRNDGAAPPCRVADGTSRRHCRGRARCAGQVTVGLAETSARQYILRAKSLLGYAHELGYTPFNAGVTIKVRSDAANRGATLAKRIITEVEVGLLVRAARTRRDRIMIEVTYAGGLRVSELVALTWSDVLPRDERVQLNIVGKGGKVRQVLLPEVVSRSAAVAPRRCRRQ